MKGHVAPVKPCTPEQHAGKDTWFKDEEAPALQALREGSRVRHRYSTSRRGTIERIDAPWSKSGRGTCYTNAIVQWDPDGYPPRTEVWIADLEPINEQGKVVTE